MNFWVPKWLSGKYPGYLGYHDHYSYLSSRSNVKFWLTFQNWYAMRTFTYTSLAVQSVHFETERISWQRNLKFIGVTNICLCKCFLMRTICFYTLIQFKVHSYSRINLTAEMVWNTGIYITCKCEIWHFWQPIICLFLVLERK